MKESSSITLPHPFLRMVSLILSWLLVFSAQGPLLAMTAQQAFGRVVQDGGKSSAANLQNAGAASASITASKAREVLQKGAAASAALRALQVSAVAIAKAAAISALPTGRGLVPFNPSAQKTSGNVPVEWKGVTSFASAKQNTTITQNQPNAYLTWKSFDVAANQTVDFNQIGNTGDPGSWIAFNRVLGLYPSQIFGQIRSPGQVYILNQNGILFHNGSQVNVHSLVASTLPINETYAGAASKAGAGIANNPESQFLFTALTQDPGDKSPGFTPTLLVNDSGSALQRGQTLVQPGDPMPVGDVVVEKGASIVSPPNQSHNGGMVALIGANVHNGGSISTPNGQTILASGLQVALLPHAANDPSLRGMDALVGKIADSSVTLTGDSAGNTLNEGVISAPQGNVTMTGASVTQSGLIDSSTSTSLNGRIDLNALFNIVLNPKYLPDGSRGALVTSEEAGSVVFSPGSITQILPEWEDTKTKLAMNGNTALALNSLVDVNGLSIHLAPGAMLLAPGAVSTPVALSQSELGLSSGVTLSASQFVGGFGYADQGKGGESYSQGSITVDPGASIYLGGSTGVASDSSQYMLKLQLRGQELADSPLQRKGPVRGKNMVIDSRISGTYQGAAWIGTPLGDATGFLNLVEQNIGEWTTAGGSIAMSAGDSVALAKGSVIDVSGGWRTYSAGKFSSSKLLYQGHLIDISAATPDRIYDGIYQGGSTVETSAKWGVTKTFDSPLDPSRARYEPAYISGAAGGNISIISPRIISEGTLLGATVNGPRQIRSTPSLSTLAGLSSLSLDLKGSSIVSGIILDSSRYAPTVILSSGGNEAAPKNSLQLPTDLFSSENFGNLTIKNHDGSILLPRGERLNGATGGSLTLEASSIRVGGEIALPSGTITMTADLVPYSLLGVYTLDPNVVHEPILDLLQVASTGEKVYQFGKPQDGKVQILHTDFTREGYSSQQLLPETLDLGSLLPAPGGEIALESGARISTAGLLTSDTARVSGVLLPISKDGGSITLAGYRLETKPGSVLDVSAGALINGSGVSYGKGGSLTLVSGSQAASKEMQKGHMELGATLLGYGGIGTSGGALTLSAEAFRVGNVPLGGREDIVSLPSGFFSEGGFSSYTLNGVGMSRNGFSTTADFTPAVEILAGTILSPAVTSRIARLDGGGVSLDPMLQDAPFRPVVSLSFNGKGVLDSDLLAGDQLISRADVLLDPGVSITLDPSLSITGGSPAVSGGSFSMSGDRIAVSGGISVPGGSVSLSSKKTPSDGNPTTQPEVTMLLTSGANISVAGLPVMSHDPSGGFLKRFGAILSGGAISLSGNIFAAQGSSLDASGASVVLDRFPDQAGLGVTGLRQMTTPVGIRLDSSAGSITLAGREGLYSLAMLSATAGGPAAEGGILTLSSGRFYGPTDNSSADAILPDLAITQATSRFADAPTARLGAALPTAPGIEAGGGEVAVASFSKGGFDTLALKGNVFFSGNVQIAVPGSLAVAREIPSTDPQHPAAGGVIGADGRVELSASHVLLGRSFQLPIAEGDGSLKSVYDPVSASLFVPPTSGSGELIVRASDVLDVGNVSLSGIGTARLDAGAGVIRGDGTFAMAGELFMRASMIYPVTGSSFTTVAFNYDDSGSALTSGGSSGEIIVSRGSGQWPLPLSAAGQLSLFADTIRQGGSLVAPFGSIRIGLNSSDAAVVDPISGLSMPLSSSVSLIKGSLLQVSGINSDGSPLSVPYGTTSDGTSWTAPDGTSITGKGLPEKSVVVHGDTVDFQTGSLMDLRGGGEVTIAQHILGTGGKTEWTGSAPSWNDKLEYGVGALATDSKGNVWQAQVKNTNKKPGSDPSIWSKAPARYAIIPGYQNPVAPTGYDPAESVPGVGKSVYLSGIPGLPAGTYTLLPASYATQPGAFLLLDVPSLPGRFGYGSTQQPDGSYIVSGSPQFDALSTKSVPPTGTTRLYEVDPSSVFAQKYEFRRIAADDFFQTLAGSIRTMDAGRAVFSGGSSLLVAGSVLGTGAVGGRGALLDLSSDKAFHITANASGLSADGSSILLNAGVLDSMGVSSLLIGGVRAKTTSGYDLTPSSQSITVDSGADLSGPEILLTAAPKTHRVTSDGDGNPETTDQIASDLGVVLDDLLSVNGLSVDSQLQAGQILKIPGSTSSIEIASGAIIKSVGDLVGNSSPYRIVGNGAVIAVSQNQGLSISRSGFEANARDLDGTPLANLTIGAGAVLSGESIVIDSSGGSSISPSSQLNGSTIDLRAGKITVSGGSGSAEEDGLLLSGSVLNSLSSAKELRLGSYSTIGLREGVVLGSVQLGSLVMSSAGIIGDGSSGNRISANSIRLDNAYGSTAESAALSDGGDLTIIGNSLVLGSGIYGILGFHDVTGNFSGGVTGQGKGKLNVSGNLTLQTEFLTGGPSANLSLVSTGDLVLNGPSTSVLAGTGAGARIDLSGSSVSVRVPILASGGVVSVSSTSGGIDLLSTIDVSGFFRDFRGVKKVFDGGVVSLSASGGDLLLENGSRIDVSGSTLGGNAGEVSLSSPQGKIVANGSFVGTSKEGYDAGSFYADIGNLPDGNLDQLGGKAVDFTHSLSFRLRNGNAVISNLKASSISLATDRGDLFVNGALDASGKSGGLIQLLAGNSIKLGDQATLSVNGAVPDAAGHGGLIDLESGLSASSVGLARSDASLPFTDGGSVLDLGKARFDLTVGGADGGTLLLKAPQTEDLADVRINPFDHATILGASSILVYGSHITDSSLEGAASIDSLSTWQALPTGLNYLPGQSVVMGDGNVYKLTVDPARYAEYKAYTAQNAGGFDVYDSDPSHVDFTARFWSLSQSLVAWDEAGTYSAGDKVLYNGSIYMATAPVDYGVDPNRPLPGSPSSSWTLDDHADGNWKQLALGNASEFMSAITGAGIAPKIGGPNYTQKIRLRPAEEIRNSAGGLVLNSDWDFSTTRYGSSLAVVDDAGHQLMDDNGAPVTAGTEPGLLSLRAAGDIVFHGALTDGFGNGYSSSVGKLPGLYRDPLLPLLSDVTGRATVQQQSWSYRIAAGADFSSADPLAVVRGESGSVQIGNPYLNSASITSQTFDLITSDFGYFQTIRTGIGSIAVRTSGDIQFLNQFSTIYTAGARVPDPTIGGTFDLPVPSVGNGISQIGPVQTYLDAMYPVQFSSGGGNVSLSAGRDISHVAFKSDPDNAGNLLTDSSGNPLPMVDASTELPSTWLYRRGAVDKGTGTFFLASTDHGTEAFSTSWWIDYSNFFEGVGALAGGNVSMVAGRDIVNVDAVIPTQARMTAWSSDHLKDGSTATALQASQAQLVEQGGGDLLVKALNSIDGGIYYAERGNITLNSGGVIITNPGRDTQFPSVTLQRSGDPSTPSDPHAYLPTTFFLGKGNLSVSALGDITMGPVANAFLMPQGLGNGYPEEGHDYTTYFSTFSASDRVTVVSAGGNILLREGATTPNSSSCTPILENFVLQYADATDSTKLAFYQPWIRTTEYQNIPLLQSLFSLSPATLEVNALNGGITIQGNLTLAPSSSGNLSLLASGGVTGYAPTGVGNPDAGFTDPMVWAASTINVSDADPAKVNSVTDPLARITSSTPSPTDAGQPSSYYTADLNNLFSETGSTLNAAATIQVKQALHQQGQALHMGDSEPIRITADNGGITGITLYAPKKSMISASQDITDVGFYIQNILAGDISVITAMGRIMPYDRSSALRQFADSVVNPAAGDYAAFDGFPSGDIQISGPGAMEVLAGGGVDFGNQSLPNGDHGYAGDASIWNGISSIGNGRNPALDFQGANIVLASGLTLPDGLSSPGALAWEAFSKEFLTGKAGARYVSEFDKTQTYSGTSLKGLSLNSLVGNSSDLTPEAKALAQLQLFYIVLRDTGSDFNKPDSPGYKSYASGEKAILTLLGNSASRKKADIVTWSRSLSTRNGGNISILAPSGGITLDQIAENGVTPGIVTEHGGRIDIFTRDKVDIGNSRIFTLRGGDIMIWSDKGDIAAGSTAKTVASAPPLRVLIDPQSGNIVPDLSGLSTGGGIGVLDTVEGIPPGNVDLIAPNGVIDAGDAGIRSSGNLNLAATKVLNADNIAASGSTSGAPPAAPPPPAPNVSGAAAASTASAASSSSAQKNTPSQSAPEKDDDEPSVFSIDVLGYGGGGDEESSASTDKASASQASL